MALPAAEVSGDTVKLADFGLAREIRAWKSQISQMGVDLTVLFGK